MTHLLAAALALQIANFSSAPPSLVHRAQEEVTRVYAEIGVPLEWGETSESPTDSSLAIRIVLLPYETGELKRSEQAVMGAAVRTPRGTAIAYIFYRRVQAEAERYEVSTDLVLACAIAPEIGHLLLPSRAHAPEGLMRACWRRDEFRQAEHGELRFRPQDVAQIRAGLP